MDYITIKTNPKFEINENGEIRRIGEDEHLKQFPLDDKTTFLRVTLKRGYYHYVHRLMGLTWLKKPNSDVRMEISHIDGDKHNNSLKNLEWIEYEYYSSDEDISGRTYLFAIN